ncbi:MAG: putative lipid II flippase FtsW [Acidobacteria bacterium]|nr:putative lipid II flippase FtsW [Acidobacteriota bacterium]
MSRTGEIQGGGNRESGAVYSHASLPQDEPGAFPSDKILLWVSLTLLFFGLAMVYSASMVMAREEHGAGFYYFLRQSVFAVGGILLMLFGMKLNCSKLGSPRLLMWMLGGSLAALVAVYFFPPVNGARRWIRLPGITLQPSEFVKVFLIVFLASYLSRRQPVVNHWRRGLLPCVAVVSVFAALILNEPDLGTTLCVLLSAAILLFAAGLRLSYLLAAAAAVIPAAYALVFSVSYRRNRMLAFLNPFEHSLGIGYQIHQSLIAVGSGGPWGTGLAGGKQKLFFLPMPHTDFIYAVIGEELGLWGCLLVLMLFMAFYWRGLRIARYARDPLERYLALGLTHLIVIQALIHASVVLSLMPNKGLPLPFISLGGSSLMATLLSVGLLLNISSRMDHRTE